MWSFLGKHVLSKTAFLGHLKRLKNGVWQRFKRSQTLHKLLTNAQKVFRTFFKPFGNACQMVCKVFQTLLKPFANASQTLCKCFSNPFKCLANPWQTLFKPFQTFRKPFANASLESRQNKSALATKQTLKLWLVFNTLPSAMNCFF